MAETALFDRARLRLTGWYLAIIAAIVLVLSYALYDLMVSLQQAETAALRHVAPHGVARLFLQDEHRLALEIVALDAGVLVLAALGAYVLAGRTLQPIQEAMRRQERFAIAASHELRTPLTVLQGTMEVALLRERTPAEYQQILHNAAAEAARMGVLIDDLLALARPLHDRDVLAREPLDLCAVVQQAADAIRPLAEQKGQVLEVDLAGPLPVSGDTSKLRQVLANLLDNAVTYTPSGTIIRIAGRPDHGRAIVEVRDTGPGIALSHLPHLFEPFYRVDSARSGAGHAGLGLALAAWIVRAHGGHISVESLDGAGTAFTIVLPLASDTMQDRGQRRR